MTPLRLAASSVLLVVATTASAADEDLLAAGAAAFEPCRACHAFEAGATALPGPDLADLMGRPVAGSPSFDYSGVLRAARAEGQVWDRAKLEAFLVDPEGMFPGTWMSYPGIRDPKERRALVAFIAAQQGLPPR